MLSKETLRERAGKFNGHFLRMTNTDHDGNPGNIALFSWDDEDDADAFAESFAPGEIAGSTVQHNGRGILESCLMLKEEVKN